MDGWNSFLLGGSFSFGTVDGSEIPSKTPPGMVLKPIVNNGINYQPQLRSDQNPRY